MVSPDGTRPEGGRPEMGRKGLLAIAIGIVAVGFVVLGSLTSAQPAAVEETTTSTTSTTVGAILPPIDLENFTIDQLQTGPQFVWEQAVLEDAQGYPIGLVAHEGALYLFATSAPDWGEIDSGGLIAWRSTDGTGWESLGQVIGEEFRVSRVVSTPEGLVAAGTAADSSSIVVWTSSDGADWASEEIPVDVDQPHLDLFVTALGGNQEAVVVMTNVEFDGQGMLEQRLAAAGFDIDLDFLAWGTSTNAETGTSLTLEGPLGLPGMEVPLEDLHLTEEEAHWVRNGFNATPEVSTWTRTTGSRAWIPGRIEGAQWVENIVTRGDGTMLLTGWSGAGPVGLQSADGMAWIETDLDLPSNRIYAWRDGLLAIDEHSRPGLLYSEGTSEWEDLGPSLRFPPQFQWTIFTLAADELGVAFSVSGYQPTTDTTAPREPVSIVTDEGHRLRLDLDERIIRLDTGEETKTWEIYRAEPPEGVEVDLTRRTVALADPDTGETLTVLSFDDLLAAEQDYHSARFLADEHQGFVFTADGEEWTIQPSATAYGDDSWIGDLEIDSGRVYAVTLQRGEAFDPFADPRVSVWSAEIP